jgi:hypothetical protein
MTALEPGICLDDFHWDDDVRYRFENIMDGHFKFYEITLTETDLVSMPNMWTLHTAYGSMKPGAHITHNSIDFRTKSMAEEVMNKNIRTRLDHGYKEVPNG